MLHVIFDRIADQNRKVKKSPQHLNHLECCFYEYLYTFIKERHFRGGVLDLPIDGFIRCMGYRSGSDNNIRNAIRSLSEQTFCDNGRAFHLFSIQTLTGKDRVITLDVAPEFCDLEFPYCRMEYLRDYLSMDQYYSRILFKYLMTSKIDPLYDPSDGQNRCILSIGNPMPDQEELYASLCSDPTHTGIISEDWKNNFGNFRQAVLDKAVFEITEKTSLHLSYETGKVDKNGQRYRSFVQIAFYMENRKPYFAVLEPETETETDSVLQYPALWIPPISESAKPKDEHLDTIETMDLMMQEVSVISPQNLDQIYPKIFQMLLSYGISPHTSVHLFLEAEKKMDPAFKQLHKRERFLMSYLKFYINLCSVQGKVADPELLRRYLKEDAKDYASIANKMAQFLAG